MIVSRGDNCSRCVFISGALDRLAALMASLRSSHVESSIKPWVGIACGPRAVVSLAGQAKVRPAMETRLLESQPHLQHRRGITPQIIFTPTGVLTGVPRTRTPHRGHLRLTRNQAAARAVEHNSVIPITGAYIDNIKLMMLESKAQPIPQRRPVALCARTCGFC